MDRELERQYCDLVEKRTCSEPELTKSIKVLLETAKNILLGEIKKLPFSDEEKLRISPLLVNVNVPIEYKIIAQPSYRSIPSGGYNFPYYVTNVEYSVNIVTTLEEIERYIISFVDNLYKIVHGNSLIRTSEVRVIRQINDSILLSSEESVRKMLYSILEKNYNIKYVAHEGEYATPDYFDYSPIYEGEEKTTQNAIVSTTDNRCIVKGHYVYISKQ